MVALEKKSGDHQSQWDLSSGDTKKNVMNAVCVTDIKPGDTFTHGYTI